MGSGAGQRLGRRRGGDMLMKSLRSRMGCRESFAAKISELCLENALKTQKSGATRWEKRGERDKGDSEIPP